MWVLAVVVLYLPCRWFAAVKARRHDWWLSYLQQRRAFTRYCCRGLFVCRLTSACTSRGAAVEFLMLARPAVAG